MKDNKMKELYRRVDEILYYLWYPIGVKDEPAARSEYSGYVSSIASVLYKTDDVKAISNQLYQIATVNMGLISNYEESNKIANLLVEAKHAIIEGLS